MNTVFRYKLSHNYNTIVSNYGAKMFQCNGKGMYVVVSVLLPLSSKV